MVAAANRLDGPTELSVVMPCLNEAETLRSCIETAWATFLEHGIRGEIVLADNGSTAGSARGRAKPRSPTVDGGRARLRQRPMAGITAARGRYVLIGDADGSFDFRKLQSFLEELRDGYDLVQGCRLERGGGRVLPRASRRCIAASATRCSPGLRGAGSKLPSMTSTAGCVRLARCTTSGSIRPAAGWSSPPR